MRALLVLGALVLAGCAMPADFFFQDRGPLEMPPLAFYQRNFTEGAGPYHTYEELTGRIAALAAQRPDLVRREVLGTSHEGRPIEALVLANATVRGTKPALLIDGGHHPNELEGVESALFTAEFLLHNYERNRTARGWLDARETWFMPLVNPDGYVAQTRTNAAGVNLNRNYDIAWCHPAAFNSCLPEPAHGTLVGAGADPPEYAGTGPFSEPESQAIRNLVLRLGDRLAFYLTHHTDLHCIFAPWVAPDAGAPFAIPAEEQAVFDAVYAWTEANTEFAGGDAAWATGDCVGYNHGGGSMDWVYATARVPAFTMETGGNPSREGAGNLAGMDPWPRDLEHWLRATLPVELLFLENAEGLQLWQAELRDPPLPEGVPPAPR